MFLRTYMERSCVGKGGDVSRSIPASVLLGSIRTMVFRSISSRVFTPSLVAMAGLSAPLHGHPLAAAAQEPAAELPAEPAAGPSLQAQINGAIQRGTQYLKTQQHRDGSWTGARFGLYRAGPTAFCAYTLVESGISANDPSIRLALAYLREHPPTMTYSAGALLLLLAEIHAQRELSPDLLELAEATLTKLVDWENTGVRGSWGYPTGAIDLSNTQFVALGFWAAHRMGLKVPLETTQRMVMTTINVHQEDPFRSPIWLSSRGKKRRTNPMIGGFIYATHLKDPVRSSMTVAGICIQKIADEVFGRKLGRKTVRASEESMELAMGWLEAHWSLSENHGKDMGDTAPLFYLWSIERLGALFDQDEFFGNAWYEPGAVVILDAEKDKTGSWGQYDQTAYALLFLSRATRAVASGTKPKAEPDSWAQSEGPVRLRVTGNMDMIAWIVDLEKKDPVAKVTWLHGTDVHQDVEGDPKRPWKGERFATRWGGAEQRDFSVVAVVSYVDGSEARSLPLKVRSSWTPEAWIERAAAQLNGGQARLSLLNGADSTAEASSIAPGQDAPRAIDGYAGTPWIANASDKAPRIDIKLGRATSAEFLTLSHPASNVASLGDFAGATEVRVWLNGGSKPQTFTLPAQSAETIQLPLNPSGKGKVKVRSLAIEIVSVSGNKARRGFGEVGLR